MTSLSLAAAAERFGGTILNPDVMFDAISIDSRSINAGDLFFAIQGPNYNGHTFIPDIENKICGKVLGPVSAPLFRLRKRYRVRLLIRGPKTLKMQNSLAITIPKFKFLSGIKLSVDVDPINFN